MKYLLIVLGLILVTSCNKEYKVKDINKGAITTIISFADYEIGDTILVSDSYSTPGHQEYSHEEFDNKVVILSFHK